MRTIHVALLAAGCAAPPFDQADADAVGDELGPVIDALYAASLCAARDCTSSPITAADDGSVDGELTTGVYGEHALRVSGDWAHQGDAWTFDLSTGWTADTRHVPVLDLPSYRCEGDLEVSSTGSHATFEDLDPYDVTTEVSGDADCRGDIEGRGPVAMTVCAWRWNDANCIEGGLAWSGTVGDVAVSGSRTVCETPPVDGGAGAAYDSACD